MTDEIKEQTPKTMAATLVANMERATRKDGSTFYRVKEGAPSWCQDVVRDSHGEAWPNDWVYESIYDAAQDIAEGNEDGGDFADSAVPHATRDRLAWLADDINRVGLVDSAIGEHGSCSSLSDAIGWAMYAELAEIWETLWNHLEEEAEEANSRAVEDLEEN